jgi:hypothetical protein
MAAVKSKYAASTTKSVKFANSPAKSVRSYGKKPGSQTAWDTCTQVPEEMFFDEDNEDEFPPLRTIASKNNDEKLHSEIINLHLFVTEEHEKRETMRRLLFERLTELV